MKLSSEARAGGGVVSGGAGAASAVQPRVPAPAEERSAPAGARATRLPVGRGARSNRFFGHRGRRGQARARHADSGIVLLDPAEDGRSCRSPLARAKARREGEIGLEQRPAVAMRNASSTRFW